MTTISVGEVNKGVYVDVGFDVNAAPFTLVRIHFTSPDGTITFFRDNPDVTAPATDSPPIKQCKGDDVVLLANNYLLYRTLADDFAVDGNWETRSEYRDAVPSLYLGDPGVLPIGKGV